MRLGLAVSTLLVATSAGAQDMGWQGDVLDMAQVFSDKALAGEVIDFNIAHMHPDILIVASDLFATTPDQLLADMRAGYEYSTSLIDVVTHAPQANNTLFGVTEGVTWGAVPFSVQSQIVGAAQPMDPRCTVVLFFGTDQDRFIWTVSGDGNLDVLHAAVPAFSDLTLRDLPECQEPTS